MRISTFSFLAGIALIACSGRESPIDDVDSAGGASGTQDAEGAGGQAGSHAGGFGGAGGEAGAGFVDSGSDQSATGGGGGASGGMAGSATGGGGIGGGGAGAAGRGDAAEEKRTSDVAADVAVSDAGAAVDRRSNDDCVIGTCSPIGGKYCGVIGDGCGGTLDCGACPAGQTCGARAMGVCGPPCPLCGQAPTCAEGSVTTITGKVFSGALTNPDPVYNAQVFIPNIALGDKLPPLSDGPSCDRCTPLDQDVALTSTVTAFDGSFTLTGDIPAGMGIPLVVQLGKWRRQITIDVNPCTNNVVPDGVARFPRNKTEGDIPLTAISSGSVDRLQCLLRKIGIEDAEFTNPGGAGRIQMYRSNGTRIDANTPAESVLVGSASAPGDWSKYTQVLFPCEGSEGNKSAATANFLKYVNGGGRAFATHYSYSWLFKTAPISAIGTWTTGLASATGTTATGTINTTFAKGTAFGQWLTLVGAVVQPPTNPLTITVNQPRFDLGELTAGAGGQLWISSTHPTTAAAASMHVTIDTPIQPDPDAYCGRVVFSDFHVADASTGNSTFPAECDADLALTPQEKVLEFMLFDLASCVSPLPPTGPPPPPPPPSADF